MLARLSWLVLLIGAVGCTSQPPTVRFATFNASLNRDKAGQLARDLSTPDNAQARNVAEVIQRMRPDVLLINEFDYQPDSSAPDSFQRNYLSVSQNGCAPIEYLYRVYLPVNTGVPSGFDLDDNGEVVTEPGSRGYGNDCFGFGQFPGQYGMLLLSKYPIAAGQKVQTFERVLWNDMPNAMLPKKADGSPWYSEGALKVLRLSSKSHWDIPLQIDNTVIHVLASHPTPPAFDGPEDRNGKRNHDEIRFWADYLRGHPLKYFVIMGDLNADPNDGSSVPGAIQQLLEHPQVNSSFTPRSAGAVEAAQIDGGSNATHKTPAEFDTADFGDTGNGPGNLRCDYVLPSKDLKVIDSGVFWPPTGDPLHRLVEMKPTVATSDHRLVYIDVQLP